MLSYADPQTVYYRLKELEADAASTRPERQHPPDKSRPAPPRYSVFRGRRTSIGQIALEPCPYVTLPPRYQTFIR